MTRYLLHTNAAIGLFASVDGPVARRARQHPPMDVCISAIVAYELYFGAFKSERVERNLALLDASSLEVVPFEKEDAREAGQIRAALRSLGQPIGPYDLLIAGQARARGLVLVTHNRREFDRVEALQVEDWSA